jgi:Ser/Thr protein kinase RdoA (MazF antagonist)
VEPGFLALIRAYSDVYPLSEDELRFLPEVYRFFILNYVVREGARFFREDLCKQFRQDAVRTYCHVRRLRLLAAARPRMTMLH